MNREQWLRERMSGIGGSDAPAALGVSKWKTPLALYMEKRGESLPAAESEPMRWGTRLEPIVRQEYADRTGEIVRLPEGLLRHPRHEWMLATVDGVTDNGRLVEIKTARTADGWGEPGTDEVPEAYLIQVQHYLAVTALSVADVAVLIGGSDFRLYEVPADAELQELIVEREAEFWRAVQEGTPPAPVSAADVLLRYGRSSRSAAVVASAPAQAAVEYIRRAKETIAELEAGIEEQRALICAELDDADTLITPAGKTLATWKAIKATESIDWQSAFDKLQGYAVATQEAVQRAIAESKKTSAASRRFLIKSTTGETQ